MFGTFSESSKWPLAPLSMHHVCLMCLHHKPLAQQRTVFHQTNKRHLDSIARGVRATCCFCSCCCVYRIFFFCRIVMRFLHSSFECVEELCNVQHFSGSFLRPFVGSFFSDQYLIRCPICLHAWHTRVQFSPPFRTTRLSKTTTSRLYERCTLVLQYVRCYIVSPVMSYTCHTESYEELGRERITALTKA